MGSSWGVSLPFVVCVCCILFDPLGGRASGTIVALGEAFSVEWGI